MMSEDEILEKNYGIWANMRKIYLYRVDPNGFYMRTVSGKFDEKLREYDEEMDEKFNRLLEAQLEKDGINEDLKGRDVMSWISGYNAARERIYELMKAEIESNPNP